MNTRFFAAANGEEGFFSLFPSFFSPEAHQRLYILKGGPGSGKSTLMRAVGREAEKRGLDTEYIFCSSDTDSLDGVRIPALGVAILDGTAPHTTDPKYPGAVETILDPGEGFDQKALSGKREEIMALCSGKAEAYRAAYRYLAAAGRMMHEREMLISEAFLGKKAESAAARLAASLKNEEKGEVRRVFLSAIGTKGEVHLSDFNERARVRIAVTQKHGGEYLFMQKLYEALSREGLAMTVCLSPLVRTYIEGIYLEKAGILFLIADEETARMAERSVGIGRFLVREALAARRARIRFAEKCKSQLMAGALESLAAAGRFHGELEAIYGEHMDFSRMDRMKTRLFDEIFENKL